MSHTVEVVHTMGCLSGEPNRIAAGLDVKPVASLAGRVCTLTLAWQVFDDAPIAVAANRDEAVDRESVPPTVYHDEPLVIAPKDAEAGGTWIGYNEFGVFVALTNKWTDTELAGERSRGLLVADVLEARSAADANAIVDAATDADEYSGFYLVVADATDAFCYQWDDTLSQTVFEPGVHVVVNVAVDDDGLPYRAGAPDVLLIVERVVAFPSGLQFLEESLPGVDGP